MFDPKQVARAKRANANWSLAAKHEADGPSSKMSRKMSTARRAQQIYGGKVDPKAKTAARLTKTSNPDVLRARMKKMKDNSASKPAAKPAASRRKPVGQISEAKAGRIVARMDANRSGLRRATGTARQTTNSIRTHQRAVDFALAAGARARKKGQSLSVNESLQRAVKNASKKRR